MAKLVKNVYITAKGERKLNCYSVAIPKKVVQEAGIKDTDEIMAYSENNKIIIEKKR